MKPHPTIPSSVLRSIIAFLLVYASLTGCSAREEHRPEIGRGSTIAAANAVNINAASIEELETLPHIGRKTAEAIVQFRTENGPFRRPEHLMQIRGISEERFLEFRQHIRTE